MVLLMLAALQLRELGNGVRVCIVLVQGPAPLLRSVLQRYKRRRQRLWPAADQLAYCKTLEITHTKLSTRASPPDAPTKKNDPHNMRRLCRPTGPQRAAMY